MLVAGSFGEVYSLFFVFVLESRIAYAPEVHSCGGDLVRFYIVGRGILWDVNDIVDCEIINQTLHGG